MTSQQVENLEGRAYREAGHATMSFLIRKGFVERFVPVDRSLMLPEFAIVSIEGQGVDWGEITRGLGSLMTVPMVLLAGCLAEQIKYPSHQSGHLPLDDPLVKKALHLITAYIEEYGSDQMSFAERDTEAGKTLAEMSGYVADILRMHWASVESLASALLQNKMLRKSEAFELIEKEITDEAKARAEAFASRNPREVMREMMRNLAEKRSRS